MLRFMTQLRQKRLLMTSGVTVQILSLLALLIYLLLLLAYPVRAQDLRDSEKRQQLLQQAAKKGAEAVEKTAGEAGKTLGVAEAFKSSEAAAKKERSDLIERMRSQTGVPKQGINLRALATAPAPLRGGKPWTQTIEEQEQERLDDRERGVGQGPLVFVSFSLGEGALKSYLQQAPRYGATLVFRGFKHNNIKTHLAALRRLIGEEENLGGMVVDPTLYHRFSIDSVPSFVLPESAVPACNLDGCGEVAFVKARGAVSIERFLGEVRRRGDNHFPELAAALIKRGKEHEQY